MMSPVLVVIDIQKEYTTEGRPFHLSEIAPSLKNAGYMLTHARDAAWPVVHVQHLQDGSIFNPADQFSGFVAGFEPLPTEAHVVKGNFSSYSSAPFRNLMETYLDREVLVIGYGSTMCCLSTIIDGYHRGQKFIFVKDASLAKRGPRFDELSTHEYATDMIATYAKVQSTAEVIG